MRVLLSSVALAVSAIVFEATPVVANCSNFCEGGSFSSAATINFSSGNDSVTCGGLVQLINTGAFSNDFCAQERANIELACCFNMGPTKEPTPGPTLAPTPPTPAPTPLPTGTPTFNPTPIPTVPPTPLPTGTPTFNPTPIPTVPPTSVPTFPPTPFPSRGPRNRRTLSPTDTPSVVPTDFPTGKPTLAPTGTPTSAPTGTPTVSPTGSPTAVLTTDPTASPVEVTAKDIVADSDAKISGSSNNLGASLKTTLLLGSMLWSAFVHWA